MFLYEKINALREYGNVSELPKYIVENLNPNFELRPYQKEAFENFITYFEGKNCPKPTQVLYQMATGSGKTLIMAGLMLYLYKQGYRNFLFFVNRSNIVEKTKSNFLDVNSSKYLFAKEIVIDGERVQINSVDNFQYTDMDAINVCFTTTQGLHQDMWMGSAHENRMSLDDFYGQKVVLISDEAHHLNVDLKKKMSAEEELNRHSWEQTVEGIFSQNAGNVLLEFTATCDLKNQEIFKEYENKIVFDYALTKFYEDRYSKEILTMRADLSTMDRVLQAIVLSQYRMKIFQDNRLSIKPVILFKEKSIPENKRFLETFSDFIKALDEKELLRLRNLTQNNEVMQLAFNYFDKKGISLKNLAAELQDDFSIDHCLLVDCKQSDREKSKKLVILNSLEENSNPYRAIFAVDMLNEGWDVLNLFDIVRLDEKRQSGGKKISPVTISEAQLIGRGARYCPFQIDEEQPKYQRKYDEDINNELRICETLYYHCQNDRNYVYELNEALRELGLDVDNNEHKEYVLKPKFKTEEIYKQGKIFINKREVKDRKDVTGIDPTIRDRLYEYEETSGVSYVDEVMLDISETKDKGIDFNTIYMSIKEIATINYAIVNKALMKYPVFKFSTLKRYFPNLLSTREFIMDAQYLGAIKIKIMSRNTIPTIETLYSAVCSVLSEIASSISKIQETYRGTKEFYAINIRDVFHNKTVNYKDPHDGGIGISQNDISVNDKWRIDLSREDWFVYTDNFGTSEEKAFVAYFKDYVNDLKKIYNKIYLVRNEREFHIYSFENGERFEPDYVLFLQRDKSNNYEQLQIFVEPKGTHLLEKDAWKEDFLLQLEKEAVPKKIIVDNNDYKIWGFHFFNREERQKEFDSDFKRLFNAEKDKTDDTNIYDFSSNISSLKVAEKVDYGKD